MSALGALPTCLCPVAGIGVAIVLAVVLLHAPVARRGPLGDLRNLCGELHLLLRAAEPATQAPDRQSTIGGPARPCRSPLTGYTVQPKACVK